jgi:hypothetical protein
MSPIYFQGIDLNKYFCMYCARPNFCLKTDLKFVDCTIFCASRKEILQIELISLFGMKQNMAALLTVFLLVCLIINEILELECKI